MLIRLFYSKKCKECMSLCEVIHNEKISDMITFICIDNYTSKQLETLIFKQVPVIVITQDDNKPMIYEGAIKCSQWLNAFTYNKRKMIAKEVNEKRKQIQKSQIEDRQNFGGALEYNDSEMNGISDEYSYCNTDLPQPKSFVNVGNEGATKIFTIANNENKISNITLKKTLKETEINRENDKRDFIKIMEQKQISAVINSTMS
jgi:hypothetical protein